MEREIWTDELIERKMIDIDKRFDRVDAELRAIRSELSAMRRHITLIVAGFGVGQLGLLGAVLAKL